MLILTKAEQTFIDQAEGYALERFETSGGDRGIIRGYRLAIAELWPNTWNYNKPSDRAKEAIGEALDELGQVAQVVVRLHPDTNKFQIIDGEHRYKELVKCSETVSVNILFGYSDTEVKRMTIILNEHNRNRDERSLGLLLGELNQTIDMPHLMMGMPFEIMEMEGLLEMALLDTEPLELMEPDPEPKPAKENEGWTTISVKVPNDVMDVIGQARALVMAEVSLNDNRAIAWGQVLEYLAADYLGR
jgi:hypothetical protein